MGPVPEKNLSRFMKQTYREEMDESVRNILLSAVVMAIAILGCTAWAFKVMVYGH